MKRGGYVVGLLIICFIVVVATLFIARSDNPVDVATLLSGYIAVPAFLLSAFLWCLSRLLFRRHQARPGAEAMLNALDNMAAAQADDIRREAVERRLLDIAPARTSWHVGRRVYPSGLPFDGMLLPAVAGAPQQIADSSRGPGTIENLHALYSTELGARLAILGNPGSGKSTMMVLLLLAALDHRTKHSDQRSEIPVPVILPVADWDPQKQDLRTWVHESVYNRHRYLRASEYGLDVVSELLRAGRISFFLDGLDELPRKSRISALEQISKEVGTRVVITCRSDEFRAVESKLPLPNLTTVELEPLQSKAIERYLTAASEATRNSGWAAVVDEVVSDPSGNLAIGLNTPLTLSLARIGFSECPNDLLELAGNLSISDFRRSVLTKFLEVAYPKARTRERARTAFALMAVKLGDRTTFYWTDIRQWVFPRLHRGPAIWYMTGGAVLAMAHNLILKSLGLLVLGSAAGLSSQPVRWTSIRFPKKQEIQRMAGFSAITYGAVLIVLIAGEQRYFAALTALATVAVIGGWMLDIWRSPVTADQIRVATPKQQLRTDVLGGITFSFALAIGLSLVVGILLHLPEGFIVGAVSGIVFGLGINETALLFASGLWTGMRGRGSYNVVRFILQARRREVLIQSGRGYQFRHLALKEAFLKPSTAAPAKPLPSRANTRPHGATGSAISGQANTNSTVRPPSSGEPSP